MTTAPPPYTGTVGTLHGPQTPDQSIQLTHISAAEPARLSKAFSLNDAGELVRSPGGELVRGAARRVALATLADFAALLENLSPAEALVYGVAVDGTVITQNALGERRQAGADVAGFLARDREHFAWTRGPGIMMLDYDPPPGGQPLARDELLATLYEHWPALREAPHCWRPSASSCIHHAETGAELRGIGGQRVYILVATAEDITRAGEALRDRLWLAGHGYFRVSKSGALLPRTLVDAAVWQPERLDFCGGAECSPPLEQRLPRVAVINPDAPPLDSTTIVSVSPRNKALIAARAEARALVADEAAVVRELWIAARVNDWASKAGNEVSEQAREARTALYRRAAENRRLLGEFELLTAAGELVTVAEVLDDPDRYHGARFRDPLEPDYGDDPRIAVAMLRSAGRPYLFSHAHGGTRYALERALQILRLIGGQLHEIVRRCLALIRIDGRVFDRGGELAELGDDGTVLPVTPESMQVLLTAIAGFERYSKTTEDWVPVDCPLALAKSVLSQRGRYGVPMLRGVITAPVMRMDGTLLLDDGYDPATGLYHHRPAADPFPPVPMHPGNREVLAALRTLWLPFREFPFVGPVDRGVFLAAILTAVNRPALPTAPGFLLDAPAAGSGKTLLATCLALLAGEPSPSMIPPADTEEEWRKRITAFLRHGDRIMVLDNLVGNFSTATLCALLTAERFRDRVLGSSTTVEFPVSALVLASGNNVSLVGDLNRRFMVSRIDPQIERPYSRRFEVNPAAICRNQRRDMVAAGLTLLRAAACVSDEHASRLASFDDWARLVQDAVLLAGDIARETPLFEDADGVTEFGNPVDSIDAGYQQDPETAKLGALLVAWHEAFRNRPARVADAINAATPGSALHDALDEIAGEPTRINPRRAGRWIERYRGRVVGGMRFVEGEVLHKVKRWSVQCVQGGGFGGFGGFSVSPREKNQKLRE